MKIKMERIVWTTDFSDCADRAFPYGAVLAGAFNARLYAFHAVDVSTVSMYGEAMVDPDDIQLRILDYTKEHILQLSGRWGVDCEPRVALGRPSEEIRYLCEMLKADLVVSGVHGRTGLERFILGSVTEKLMHTLPCPLLAVKETGRPLDEKNLFKRILVGCDFSVDSNRALDYGLALAQFFQSDVHLVHVIDPWVFKNLKDPGAEGKGPDPGALKERLEDRLRSMVPEEAVNWCQPAVTVVAGRPFEELSKYAVLNEIDLTVLGIHGRGFVEKLLVGSTLDRVIRHGDTPVLAVRAS